jgi:putative flippase GtrA
MERVGLAESRAERATRFLQFGAVGASGVLVDIGILTATLTLGADVLLANALAWSVAATTNFAGNWWFTYDRPSGSLARFYGRYVWSRGATFAIRFVLVSLLANHLGVLPLPASLVGVLAAVFAGFGFAEAVVFRGEIDG